MWVVRLTEKQLEVLRALLRAQEHLGPALQRSLQALDLARWDELPEAELPWSQVAERRAPPGRLRGRRRLGPVRLTRRAPAPIVKRKPKRKAKAGVRKAKS